MWFYLIPLLLFVCYLGVRGLNADMLWWDEYLSLRMVGGAHLQPRNLAEVWDKLATDNPWQTPGYFLLLDVWGGLVGWSPLAVRTLSLLAGLLAVALTYRLGRDLLSPRGGLYAAVGLAGSALFMYYTHELRTYALLTLFSAASLWTYWRLMHAERPSPGLMVGFVASVTGLLYTHYAAGLVAVGLGLWHVVFVAKNRRWLTITGLFVLAGLLFLPWVGVMVSAVDAVSSNTQRQELVLDAVSALERVAFGYGNGLSIVTLMVAVIGVLAVVGTQRGVSACEQGAQFALFMSATVLGLTLALNAVLPFLSHIRYTLGLLPLWALVFALALLVLERVVRLGGVIALVWLVFGGYLSLTPAFHQAVSGEAQGIFFRPNLQLNVAAEEIADHVQVGDVVILESPLHSWALAGAFDVYMSPLPVRAALSDQLPGAQPEAYQDAAASTIGDAQRVWLAVEHNAPPTFRLPVVEQLLSERGFATCESALHLPDLSLQLYSRSPLCCTENLNFTRRLSRFSESISLLRADVPYQQGDAALAVSLSWAVEADVPPDTYSVALHLLTSDDTIAAQVDYPLPGDPLACRLSALPLTGLPPGDYRLKVVVYDWRTGERLSLSPNSDPGFVLRTVEINGE